MLLRRYSIVFLLTLLLLSLIGCSSTGYSTRTSLVAPKTIRSPANIPPELVPYVPRFVALLQAKGFAVGKTEDPRALDLVFEFDGNPFNLRVSAGLWREGIPILSASATNSGWGTVLARGSAVSALADSTVVTFEAELQNLITRTKIGGEKKAESVDSKTEESTLSAPLPARPTYVPLASVDKLGFGDYHALVIGINSYRSVTQLKTAVNDAKSVAELLGKEYGFKVKLLLDATRNQMLGAFDGLRKTLTEKDNLLIYYAGHGHLDRDSDRGFWLPVDADRDRRANWLSNSDIADMVRATRAKHVLVVADSCYAGTLTRSLSVQLTGVDNLSRLAQKRARTVLTSGGLEPVEDSGGGQHSVFAKAFLDSLRANNGAVDMSQIFASMRRQVMLGSEQTPQYGDIRQVGHEGGDFIFVRRRAGN